jgi:hypothetical protein
MATKKPRRDANLSVYRPLSPLRSSPKKWYAFQVPDVHRGYHVGIPSHDPMVWDVGMRALRSVAKRITHVIIYGDFGNWESLSHWAGLRADQPFIEEDVEIARMGLREIESIVDPHGVRKIFIMGNHEEWATLLEAKYPILRNQINLAHRLHLTASNRWMVVPNNHFFKLGKSYHTHGNYPGGRNAESMVKEIGASTFYGHNHRREVLYFRNLKGVHTAQSLGCWALIDPPPPYAHAKLPSGWVHGFGLLQVRANGLFQCDFRTIVESSYVEMPDGTEIVAEMKSVRARLREEQDALLRLRKEYSERYYAPDGRVHELEPLKGTELRTRIQRARVHGQQS